MKKAKVKSHLTDEPCRESSAHARPSCLSSEKPELSLDTHHVDTDSESACRGIHGGGDGGRRSGKSAYCNLGGCKYSLFVALSRYDRRDPDMQVSAAKAAAAEGSIDCL